MILAVVTVDFFDRQFVRQIFFLGVDFSWQSKGPFRLGTFGPTGELVWVWFEAEEQVGEALPLRIFGG